MFSSIELVFIVQVGFLYLTVTFFQKCFFRYLLFSKAFFRSIYYFLIFIISSLIIKFTINLKIPIYILLPTIFSTVIYFMVQYGDGNENFGMFCLILILVANSSFSLGRYSNMSVLI
jgi:hypothetical protein